MPRFALSALPALALLALTGCSNYGAFDVGVTQGGAQDLSLARGQIEAGGIPDQSAITAEGLFSEHDLPLEGDACAQLLCPVTAAASVDPWTAAVPSSSPSSASTPTSAPTSSAAPSTRSPSWTSAAP
ncbi:MAG: hypothetical protein H6740_02565 [Alphaproteobacteria bacterium]|nr:hypothetical protein [Alphaproteobacteria bacterium]